MKLPVTKIIDDVVKKLPPVQVIRMDDTFFTGAELKLTAVKDFKGQPIKDDEVYRMDLPVVRKINHRVKLRTAYLAYGLKGIYDYLLPYFGEEQINILKQRFMRVSSL